MGYGTVSRVAVPYKLTFGVFRVFRVMFCTAGVSMLMNWFSSINLWSAWYCGMIGYYRSLRRAVDGFLSY